MLNTFSTGLIHSGMVPGPAVAMTLSVIFHPALRRLASCWQPGESAADSPLVSSVGGFKRIRTVQLAFPKRTIVRVDSIHWTSSGLASLARGSNDTPKILAMLFLGTVSASGPRSPFSSWRLAPLR